MEMLLRWLTRMSSLARAARASDSNSKLGSFWADEQAVLTPSKTRAVEIYSASQLTWEIEGAPSFLRTSFAPSLL